MRRRRRRIRGVAIDLEGPIIDMEKFHFEAFIRAAAELGLSLTFESIVEQIPYALGGGDRRVSQGIAGLISRPDAWEEIFNLKRHRYSRLLENLERIEARPGFMEALDQIKSLGLNVAIGSSTPIEQARILLERSGVGRLFPPENLVFEPDVENLKPAPDVYLETARRMHIDPAEQLVIEDTATGLIAARLAGSRGIAVPVYCFRSNLVDIITAGAVRIIHDWRETNVTALIENLNRE